MAMGDLMFTHTMRFCKSQLLCFSLERAFGVLKQQKGLHYLYGRTIRKDHSNDNLMKLRL